MWELDCEESWAPKNWCFWTVVLEKTLESPLDCEEIQLVHPKGDQSWVFIGRIDAEAVTPILWPPHTKSWLIWKDPDAGKDWGQEEKGTTEDGMVGWHHRLNGHGFRWTPGIGDGQGGLACYSSWGYKESDTTERLNWTELNRAPIASVCGVIIAFVALEANRFHLLCQFWFMGSDYLMAVSRRMLRPYANQQETYHTSLGKAGAVGGSQVPCNYVCQPRLPHCIALHPHNGLQSPSKQFGDRTTFAHLCISSA